MLLHLCVLSITDVPATDRRPTNRKDKAEAYLTGNSMTCRCDLCEFVCKAPIWFLSYKDWMSYPSFSCEAEKIWKASLGKRHWWNNFHSVEHCQYVVSYAYSRYVNVCPRREKKGGGESYNSRARAVERSVSQWARGIRSWFCCSGSSQLLLSTFPDSQHSSIAVQADVPALVANSYNFFAFGRRCSFAGRLQSDRKQQKKKKNCLPPLPGERERGRVVSG